MEFVFHPQAEIELNKAIDHYCDIKPALGYDFALEVKAAIDRAVNVPLAWQVIEGDIRRSLVHRFPYGVLYSVEVNYIIVIAIMHLHREPGYWKARL